MKEPKKKTKKKEPSKRKEFKKFKFIKKRNAMTLPAISMRKLLEKDQFLQQLKQQQLSDGTKSKSKS